MPGLKGISVGLLGDASWPWSATRWDYGWRALLWMETYHVGKDSTTSAPLSFAAVPFATALGRWLCWATHLVGGQAIRLTS